jgi:hypothetical protein
LGVHQCIIDKHLYSHKYLNVYNFFDKYHSYILSDEVELSQWTIESSIGQSKLDLNVQVANPLFKNNNVGTEMMISPPKPLPLHPANGPEMHVQICHIDVTWPVVDQRHLDQKQLFCYPNHTIWHLHQSQNYAKIFHYNNLNIS